ncbi:ABC transporter ATP-binding protein [Clostridium felsineum]|uniref:Multidrug resistance ABC transporter ATP-binding/permease protein YheI n=1 Tax=Clostridium felsineum TaxID=36839 RepID=A0A1S8KYZ9_9CLOT|nr:ABC transporter ATP-binding protein [Clostridium felsineum]URZ07817.1 putative multidrug resistance ABC transporter ATP-binding/permease protein YheI [Clostridium felsineum]URZ12848.1 putative multidrug resistance ABC transporter ATP-binding/permease protein YheI [Clostridium felsineum]
MGNSILLSFFKKNKFKYILGFIFVILSSYIQTLFPKVLGNTIDILKQNNFSILYVKKNILYIILIAIFTFAFTYIWRNLIIGTGRTLECHLREQLFDKFLELSPEFYNNEKTGNLIAYAINDISAVRMTFGPSIAMSINGLTVCISSIYSMIFSINLRLTLLCLAPIPFIIVIMFKISKLIRTRFTTVQESFGNISDKVNENISGIRVIKAYVEETKEVGNFEKLNDAMSNANLKMVRVSSALSPIIELCFSISFSLNLIIGGNMVLKNSVSLGDFVAFNTYLAMIMAPVLSIGRVLIVFQRGMASLKRLNKIFSTKRILLDGEKNITKSFCGNINIKGLNFTYKGTNKLALKNINLSIRKGEVIGIVGKTGSGKTTLANLLLKLYNVENSTIYFDNTDINDYNLSSIRNNIGCVLQDNFLFSSTIKNNITFFKNIYTDEEIINAAKMSLIYKTILSFENGFDTILGERGINLSGGQKQRLSLARALVKNPKILILDDALSAVDTVTETKIIENLQQFRHKKTLIIIAHRLSAVKNADKIIVLDKGEISEMGTHKELLEQGGLYYDIYKEQYENRE